MGLAGNFCAAQLDKEPHEMTWTRPNRNTYKLNIDAAFHANGSGAAGAILRDHKGSPLAGACWPLDNLLDAATAEALALQKDLTLIECIRCSPVIIETDSMELCQSYNGVIEIWSPYSAILVDCFVKAHSIGSVSVQHCRREANVVAHNLAKHALETNSYTFWEDDPPRFIFADVMNDVSLFD